MGRYRRVVTTSLVLLFSSTFEPGCLWAQEPLSVRAASTEPRALPLGFPQDSVLPANPWRSIGLGLLGGVVGLVGGGVIGYSATGGGETCGDDACGTVGGFWGAVAGEVIGLSLGVHLGNERRGSFAMDLLAASALAGVGIGAMVRIDPDSGGLLALAATPILQLAVTVPLDRVIGRSRVR